METVFDMFNCISSINERREETVKTWDAIQYLESVEKQLPKEERGVIRHDIAHLYGVYSALCSPNMSAVRRHREDALSRSSQIRGLSTINRIDAENV